MTVLRLLYFTVHTSKTSFHSSVLHQICVYGKNASVSEENEAALSQHSGLAAGHAVSPVQLQEACVKLEYFCDLLVCFGSQGTTFTAMLSEMLDAVRWSSDPWSSANSGASLSAAASRTAVALSNSPSHRCNGVATATLAAHPYRPLYLSGISLSQLLPLNCSCSAESNWNE